MRKIILFVFLLTLAPIASFAATSCPSDATLETCSTNPGCYWNATTATCTLCPVGTYNAGGTSNTGQTSCTSCGKLGNKVSWASATGIENASDCAWSATCDAGEYLEGYTYGCKLCKTTGPNTYGPASGKFYSGNTQKPSYSYDSFNDDCRRCGANASPNANDTNCNCNPGYHKEGSSDISDITNTGTEPCVANQYTITLNHPSSLIQRITYTEYKEETTAVYDRTIKITEVPHGADIALPSKDRFKRTGYELSIWRFSGGTFAPGERVTNIKADRTFYADWTAKNYTVRFLEDENQANKPTPEQYHYYDLTCTFGKGCFGQSITQISSANKKGRIFKHWTCHKDSNAYGCTATEIGYGSTANGTIPEPNTEETDANRPIYKIYGVWTTCPAGYYCDGTQENCPAGTTSDKGSDEKKDCYMQGGKTKTKIKGNNGEFTLPADLKLYYRGS